MCFIPWGCKELDTQQLYLTHIYMCVCVCINIYMNIYVCTVISIYFK